jgi:magnesium transporter
VCFRIEISCLSNVRNRDSGPLQTRRQSIHQNVYGSHTTLPSSRSQTHKIFQPSSFLRPLQGKSKLSRAYKVSDSERDEDIDEGEDADDRTPLMSSSNRHSYTSERERGSHTRGSSRSTTSRKSRPLAALQRSTTNLTQDYDVNNPPSVPGSPILGADIGYDDAMLTGELAGLSPPHDPSPRPVSHDALIDIDDESTSKRFAGLGQESGPPLRGRRLTLAQDDVCFPHEGLSELGQEDYPRRGSPEYQYRQRRRRFRLWPELSVLEEWSQEEREQRSMGEARTRKVSEPLMIGGRLRPQKRVWHREDEDIPYRFTYFNEEFQSTVHSQTISELLQPGQTFKDLFIPDPPLLSDDSSDEEEEEFASKAGGYITSNGLTRESTRQSSRTDDPRQLRSPLRSPVLSADQTSPNTPIQAQFPNIKLKPPRHGPRPVFWLDVLSPTDAEMRVISKAFGIHPLTAEDIMMQEAREKVELFRHYYFVNYRSFEQDTHSEDYMEPVNMYVVVFRDGVISVSVYLDSHLAVDF